MSYAVNGYLAARSERRNAGRVKSPITSNTGTCSRKECHNVVEWSIYRWSETRSGRRVRRGVRFVCGFHAASIPEDEHGNG